MSVYSYLCCQNCGTALWLGKRVASIAFWRANTTPDGLEKLAGRFLARHLGLPHCVVDEQDLPDDVQTDDDFEDASAEVTARDIELRCSCGQIHAMGGPGLLSWMEVHGKHTFVPWPTRVDT